MLTTQEGVRGLLAHGNHLVTRVKSNSVAYFPATPPPPHRARRRGRPAKYGKKIKVAALLKEEDQLQEAPSPVYGEQGVTPPLPGRRPIVAPRRPRPGAP